jgi:hypothetical protein
MMMNPHKKMAMLIIKGMTDSDKQAKANDMEQGVKTKKERDKFDEYHSSMGPEAAVRDLMDAFKHNDVPKAAKALKMFLEMADGMEYMDDECKGEESDNPLEY